MPVPKNPGCTGHLPRQFGVEIECYIPDLVEPGCPCDRGDNCSCDHCRCEHGCECPCRCDGGCDCSDEERCPCREECNCDSDDLEARWRELHTCIPVEGGECECEPPDDLTYLCACADGCRGDCDGECRCASTCICEVEDRCSCRDGCECECPCLHYCEHDSEGVSHVPGLPRGWTCKGDGSLNASEGGVEIVSPPTNSLDDVRQACAVINKVGGEVNDSCGLHVHVDARDLDAVGLTALYRIWTQVGDTVWRLVSAKRRMNSSYCSPWMNTEHERAEEDIGNGLSPAGAFSERFRDLNFRSYRLHGTIEFRLHQGSTNPTKIAVWTTLMTEIVEAAYRVQVESAHARTAVQDVEVPRFRGRSIRGLVVYLAALPWRPSSESLNARRRDSYKRLKGWREYLTYRAAKLNGGTRDDEE